MLGESLLATQMGKFKRLICKKDVHETLQMFVAKIKDDFEMPELKLPMQDYENTGIFSERGRSKSKRRTRS